MDVVVMTTDTVSVAKLCTRAQISRRLGKNIQLTSHVVQTGDLSLSLLDAFSGETYD